MTKVLHIGKYYPPVKGGIETFTEQLAKRTASHPDFEVRALVFNNINKSVTENLDKVRVIRPATLGVFASQPISFRYLTSLVKEFIWADIIHIHTPNPLAELAILILSFLPKKIVITHHSDIYKQSTLKKITYLFYNRLLKRCNSLVAPTKYHYVYSDVIQGYEKKMIHIPYGIDTDEDVAAVEVEIPFTSYFLFVGRLAHYKGLKDLVQAMKNVDSNLIIAGNGEQFEEIQSLIKSLSLSDKIKIYPSLSNEQVKYLYQNCISFVLPSNSKCENFGIVQLEAMRAARPVIVSDLNSGVRGVYEGNDCAVTFKVGDVQDLTTKLSQVLSDQKLREKLGQNGRKAFLAKFTSDKMSEDYISLYQQLMNPEVNSTSSSGSHKKDVV